MTGEEPPPGSARSADRIAEAVMAAGRRVERLRLTVQAVAGAAVLLVAAVLWLGRAATVDPTHRAADALEVPAWAATSVADRTYGSRWCLGECRVRMRTWTSEGPVEDTHREFGRAALESGWLPADEGLCVGGPGEGGCYVRDQLFLELWVVPAACDDRGSCTGSEVTAVLASQAALPRLAEERGTVADDA
ncbi:hypothetical protein [Glycomyces xiaoerkulensis]|uniref:hypothetical protein n=1 Tax=Glycomyces xiaoerkulensis TaxID=2038139 RepID=UPI000C2637F2|nr:hypothetical protein [Glycomyces xiaoerkulensis]